MTTLKENHRLVNHRRQNPIFIQKFIHYDLNKNVLMYKGKDIELICTLNKFKR